MYYGKLLTLHLYEAILLPQSARKHASTEFENNSLYSNICFDHGYAWFSNAAPELLLKPESITLLKISLGRVQAQDWETHRGLVLTKVDDNKYERIGACEVREGMVTKWEKGYEWKTIYIV